MGLFTKKNKNAPEQEAAPISTSGAAVPAEDDASGKKSKKDKKAKAKPAPKPKKAGAKDEGLLKIFDESVWETVYEQMKDNKQFTVPKSDGEGVKHLLLLLDHKDIGGFTGKDAKKDESRGSIIEAIKRGSIRSYTRPDMLAEGLICIIPDKETISNMDEFVLLSKDCTYTLCSTDATGVVTIETERGSEDDDDPEIKVTYKQVADLLESGESAAALLPYMKNFQAAQPAFMQGSGDDPDADAEPDPFGEADPDDTGDKTIPDSLFGDGPDEDIESDPFGEDILPDDDFPDDDLPTGDFPSDMDDLPDEPDDGGFDPGEFDTEPETEPDTEPETEAPTEAPTRADAGLDGGAYDEYPDVTEQTVKEYVTRQFYSDDLRLEVSTQPFDAAFLHENTYVPFNENRGEGWLNEYLSNLSKDANTAMNRMHNENLFRMREMYMRLVQNGCADIAKSLSLSDADTFFGGMFEAIRTDRDRSLERVDQHASKKRESFEAAWEAKVAAAGETAAAAARQDYIDRYGAEHDRERVELETREKDEIERDYQNRVNEMHDDRRREAAKLLDVVVNESLKTITDKYLLVLRDEKREYIRLQNEITKFIDDNRKDEKSRIEALAEENRQARRSDEVRREYAAKLQTMASEFESQKQILLSDLERTRADSDAMNEKVRRDSMDHIAQEKEKSAKLQKQLDELLAKYADLDKTKNEEFAKRIADMERINKSKDAEIQHVMDSNKRSNSLAAFFVAAIAVAAVGVGFMIGSVFNVRNTATIEQQGIYRQYDPYVTGYQQGYQQSVNEAKSQEQTAQEQSSVVEPDMSIFPD